jgi:hypothetical protein
MKGQFSFNFRLQCRFNFRHHVLRLHIERKIFGVSPFLIYLRATPSASFRKMFGNCRCNAMMFELHEVEGA